MKLDRMMLLDMLELMDMLVGPEAQVLNASSKELQDSAMHTMCLMKWYGHLGTFVDYENW